MNIVCCVYIDFSVYLFLDLKQIIQIKRNAGPPVSLTKSKNVPDLIKCKSKLSKELSNNKTIMV